MTTNCRGCLRYESSNNGQFYEFMSGDEWLPQNIYFDTDKLNQVLIAKPRQPFISDWDDFRQAVASHEIFEEHINHVDHHIPVMLGDYRFHHPTTGEERVYQLSVDGHHRMAKCIKRKLPVKFVLFSEEEMLACSHTNVIEFLKLKGMFVYGVTDEEFRNAMRENDPYWKERLNK